jgi:hypothetical protein
MQTKHDELRDELVAILGAGRELTADADTQLADAFVHFLEQQRAPEITRAPVVETPHQPHYSLKLAGAMWGAALMFLFLLLVLDDPRPEVFIAASVMLLSLVAAVSRAFLFMARHGWRMPHIHVSVAADRE